MNNNQGTPQDWMWRQWLKREREIEKMPEFSGEQETKLKYLDLTSKEQQTKDARYCKTIHDEATNKTHELN